MILCKTFGSKRVEPFNLDLASVYSVANLSMAVLWVLIVDSTKGFNRYWCC